MTRFLANLYGAFATIPFISFFVIYWIAKWKTRDRKESLKWAVHITTLLLWSAVSVMMKRVTGSAAGVWWIILILAGMGGVLLWLQWKIRKQIFPAKVLRSLWYLSFLVFSLSYVILFISGVVIHYQNT